MLKLSFRDTSGGDLQTILAGNAPQLEDLSVTIYEDLSGPPPLDLFGGTATRLRKLEVGGISVHLGCPLALRKLQLEDIPTCPPSLEDITGILRNNFQLECLVPRSWASSDGAEPVSSSESLSIHLPQLRELILCDLPVTLTNHLLSAIDNPPSQYFELEAAIMETSLLAIDVQRALHFLKGTLQPVLRRSGRVHIRFGDEDVDAEYFTVKAKRLAEVPDGRESYDVKLVVTMTARDTVLRLFIDTVLPQLQQADVGVAISHDITDAESWVPWLSRIARLTEVDCPAWAIGPLGLSLAPDGDGDPPCPNLQIVKFSNWDPCFWYEVVAIAEHRYHARKGTFKDLVHPIPVLTFQVKAPGAGEYTALLNVMKDGDAQFVYELYR